MEQHGAPSCYGQWVNEILIPAAFISAPLTSKYGTGTIFNCMSWLKIHSRQLRTGLWLDLPFQER
jgi:hypothetical protein